MVCLVHAGTSPAHGGHDPAMTLTADTPLDDTPPAAPVAAPPREPPLVQQLGVALLGAAVFGLAAGLGHGPAAMLRGAWTSPALFLGGAALATPPLYLIGAWAGERSSAEELVSRVTSVAGAAGIVLLGLSAPAAFFSVTLRTHTAWALLMAAVITVGASSVRAVARRALTELSVASLVWTVFAFAIGLRLLSALAHQIHA